MDTDNHSRPHPGRRMTEDEFLERWRGEQDRYRTWGNFVAGKILHALETEIAPESVDIFVRIPVSPRLKGDGSIISKAYYRGKNYENPYEDITDKVGVRFVVLLPSHIGLVEAAIESVAAWEASKDRDWLEETEQNPYEFNYQSVHYILRNTADRRIDGCDVTRGVTCEVQIRTLLQHAHSELTHDTIYKPKVVATPAVRRAAAKSMALIEATSDYFEDVVREISEFVSAARDLSDRLADIYRDAIGRNPEPTKTEGLLVQSISPFYDGKDAVVEITEFISAKPYIPAAIERHARSKLLFRQPSILAFYHNVASRPNDVAAAWPLTREELVPIYTDLGISLDS